MSWNCAAITNGMTFYSDGTITPCCMIDHSYRKPISQAFDQPFADLVTGEPPSVCSKCHDAEAAGIKSYRQFFNQSAHDGKGLQFVDIRNFNLCNAKCRTCGPYNSSQWAYELDHAIPIVRSDLSNYKKLILNPDLQLIYYTGGEPFINNEHWSFLDELIATNLSKQVTLRYNTNLSTLKYKDRDIVQIWQNFNKIEITVSIDAVGEKFNYIRSGLDWNIVDQNLKKLLRIPNVSITIGTTVSILNLWFISELLDYYHGICRVQLTDLHHPDYLSLSAVPTELQNLAMQHLDDIMTKYQDKNKIKFYQQQILNNDKQTLFVETLNHVLLLDHIRGEKLFDLLPFEQVAKAKVFYE